MHNDFLYLISQLLADEEQLPSSFILQADKSGCVKSSFSSEVRSVSGDKELLVPK